MSKATLVLVTLLPPWLYAVARYVWFGTTPWHQVPAWVTNKALAVSALTFIVISMFAQREITRRHAGSLGFYVGMMHTVLSLVLLGPSHYPAWFEGTGKLAFLSQISLLAGALGMTLLVKGFVLRQRPPIAHLRTLLILAGFHLMAMGWQGWLKPGAWPACMPPITLWSFLIAAYALTFSLFMPLGMGVPMRRADPRSTPRG